MEFIIHFMKGVMQSQKKIMFTPSLILMYGNSNAASHCLHQRVISILFVTIGVAWYANREVEDSYTSG